MDSKQTSNSNGPPHITSEVKDLAKKIKEYEIPKINYLVFSGGGTKGFAYIGALQALKRLNVLDVKELAAVSVGSIFSLVFSLKYSPEELYSFITSFEYGMVKSFDFINALENWGVETGHKFMAFLQAMVRNKLHQSDVTFKELYEYNPIKLTIGATFLNHNEMVYYNYLNAPNESVLRCIRKSMSIPGMFTPVKDDNGDIFVDGGMLNNFPMNQVPDSDQTLGFCFSDGDTRKAEINYLENYLYCLFFSVINYNTQQNIRQSKNSKSHVIFIDPMNNSAYNLFTGPETRKKLWESGYQSTIKYFQNIIEKAESNQMEEKNQMEENNQIEENNVPSKQEK